MFEVVSRRQVRSCDLDLARSATCLWKGRNCQAAERRLDALALKQNLLDTAAQYRAAIASLCSQWRFQFFR